MTAIALQMPKVVGHPNRLPFRGVLTLVDVASDKSPSGARDHRVILTKEAAVEALPGLIGMAVDFKAGWDGHNAKQKCGIITAARIDGIRVRVSGFLYARDYAGMVQQIEAHPDDALGMSYELADAHVRDMRAKVWVLDRATFTGAAILLRSKAAYRRTEFHLCQRPAHKASTTGVEMAAVVA